MLERVKPAGLRWYVYPTDIDATVRKVLYKPCIWCSLAFGILTLFYRCAIALNYNPTTNHHSTADIATIRSLLVCALRY